MTEVRIVSHRRLPDPVRTARCARSPDLGPKILFFSGGSALRGLSRTLTGLTHNSIHLITPFDSGGSSAKLRHTFRMPAVGDIRNRLMALADQSLHGNPQIFDLFAHRFPAEADNALLHEELGRMAQGRHPLVAAIPDPMRKIIRTHFYDFLERAGEGFDLRGASMGNLMLTSGYLMNRRHLDSVIYLFSMLVRVLGTVRPVVNKDLHLAAELEDGRIVTGQHRLTGKETTPLTSPIRRLWTTASPDDPEPAPSALRPKVAKLIRSADLICYPMGSFYTSLMACLTPEGLGAEIGRTPCPKVFIPNSGPDPELLGHDLDRQVETVLHRLTNGGKGPDPALVLDFVLVDGRGGHYGSRLSKNRWTRLGIQVIDCPLVSTRSSPRLDPELLAPVLTSLAQ